MHLYLRRSIAVGVAAAVGLSVAAPAHALSSLDSPQGLAVMAASGSTLAINTAGITAAGVGAYGWSEGWFSGEGSSLPTSTAAEPGWSPSNTKSFRWPDLGGAPACPTDGGSCVLSAGTFTLTHPLYLGTGMVNLTVKGTGPCRASFMFDVYYLTSSGALGNRPGSGYYVGNNAPGGCTGTGNYSWNSTTPFYGIAITNNSGTEQMRYVPEGSPARPPLVEAGTGTLTRTAECTNAAGVVQTVTDSVTALRDDKTNLAPLGCPPGYMMTGYGSSWTPAGGATTTLVPEGTDTPWAQTPGLYPECVGNLCLVTLWQVTPAGLASCGVNAVACPEWYSDPARADNYECQYGPYQVELSACSTMRTPGQVRPNVEPLPDGTLKVQPWPTLEPNPALGESPAPAPSPEPGGDATPRDCFPNGYSVFNPFQWVYMPISCAFLPREGFWPAQVQGLRTDVATRAPFSVIGVLPPLVSGLGSGWSGGCSSSSMPNFSTIEGAPLRLPCAPPSSAAWTTAYVVMTVCLWVGVLLAVWRMAYAAIGGKG